jgi:hypothetical protein
MKNHLVLLFAALFLLSSCLDLTNKSRTIASYHLADKDFYLDITETGGGATSADFMQIRRVYKDSTYEVVNNIPNADSVVYFRLDLDTIDLIVRGRQSYASIPNDTFRFSVNNSWTSGRFTLNHE